MMDYNTLRRIKVFWPQYPFSSVHSLYPGYHTELSLKGTIKKQKNCGKQLLCLILVIIVSLTSGCSSSSNSEPQSTEPPQGEWLTNLQYSENSGINVNPNSRTYASDGSGYNHYLSGCGSIVYLLHGMYSSLSARWVLDANWDNANADAGSLLIYADDALVFRSSPINISDKLFQDVYINLSGCNRLRIEFTRYKYPHMGGYFSGNIGRLNSIWLEPYTSNYNNSIQKAQTPQNTIKPSGSLDIQYLPCVLHCTHYDGNSYLGSSGIVDNLGNKYQNGYYDFCSYYPKLEEPREASALFRATGNWKCLRGRIFARPRQESGFMIRFKIFADERLVFDSGLLSRDSTPVDFDIDIGYADRIKMQSYSDDYTMMGTNPGIILVNAEVYN